MPKRKSVPKPHTVHGSDRGAGHTLTATVGDVLEYMHTDAAIELLYAQDNLAAGRPINDPTALMGEHTAPDTVDAVHIVDIPPAEGGAPVSDRARDANAAETGSGPAASASPTATPAGILRFLSPKFVGMASRDAFGEILSGVRRARHEMHKATIRARRCFIPS